MAVVIDPEFGDRVTMLATSMHVWLRESPKNDEAARRFWDNDKARDDEPLDTGITTFAAEAGRSSESVLLRVLDDVEEHHGHYVHDPPMSELVVIGAELSPTVRAALHDMGMSSFRKDESGFRCSRRGSAI